MRISNKFLISFLFLSYAAIFSRAFKQGIKPYTLKAKTNILQKQVSIFKLKLAKKITQDANFPENQYRSKSNWNKLADFWNKLINFLQQIKILPTREIDAIDQNGSTELIRATVNQDEKKVLELLKDRANANIQNNNGETALICAAKNGYTNITKRLIKTSDLNIQDSYLRTALIWSVENRHKNIATMLITRGAALNKQDKYGDTAIMIASRNGETDLIQLLLDRNADANKVNKLGNSALNLAY
jgi:ankyrin repeat protein